MDGNGRFAKARGKSRAYGHRKGHAAVLKAVRFAASYPLKSLTLYAFSSENWQRPALEVNALIELFSYAIKRNAPLFFKHEIRFSVIGDLSRFPNKLQAEITALIEKTKHHNGLTLNIAANYGGRWDIVQASKQIAEQAASGALDSAQLAALDEATFARYLTLANQPPVDLLIRTGGDMRISNFLLWQCAYAELYFTETFWPAFDEACFAKAIEVFAARQRRFGALPEEEASS